MAQLKDLIRVKYDDGECIEYHILEVESGRLFNPNDYNLKLNPRYYEDICIHEGYCGLYELYKTKFILKNIYTNQDTNNRIRIKNISATNNSPSFRNQGPYQTLFNTIYRGVNIDFSNFTGTIILGKLSGKELAPIVPLEEGMDFWKKKYDEVIRITFKNRSIAEFNRLWTRTKK